MTEVSMTFETNEECFQPGLDPQEVLKRYDEWSASYDKMMMSEGAYRGPPLALEEILAHVPARERAACRVLDIGAGTGILGTMLERVGFRHLDAVEPSLGMISILREKRVYKTVHQVYMGNDEDKTIAKDSYDVVVGVGVMGENHLPVNSIDDLIRVTKPGGLIIIVMREENVRVVEAYKDKLEPYMKRMEEAGRWKEVTRKIVPNYFCNKDGLVLTYRVM